MKKILNILVIVMVSIIIGLLVFVNYKVTNTPCKSLSVVIDYNNSDALITNNDIESQIISACDSLVGRPMKTIDLTLINKSLVDNPVIKKANIHTSFGGEITVQLSQRRPILRVCNKEGDSYYVSEDGVLLNVRPLFPVRVPVANGDIFTTYYDKLKMEISPKNDQDTLVNSMIIYQLYKMGLYIDKDEWLKLFIDQIYVSNKDFILIPRIGNFSIVFGTTEKMAEKFNKLKTFIEKGIPKVGWDKYKTINLAYDNQIVCTKINQN
ncbi:MAG: hypothetical protein WCH34_08475 [Bacteroidota bacterium]